MKRRSEGDIRLTVHASDELTGIIVRDGDLRDVVSGVGRVTTRVAPGLFKVRFTVGSASKDQFVEVSASDAEVGVDVYGDPLQIDTTVPLSASRSYSETATGFLTDLSMLDADRTSHRSQLLVYLRDRETTGFEESCASIRLFDVHGDQIATFADEARHGSAAEAGIALNVAPGVYRARVETGQQGDYEVFLTAPDGWQSRLFLECDDFYWYGEPLRRPSLRSASILMAPIGEPFDPGKADARLAQIALSALSADKHVLEKSDMQDLLHGKFQDPMLGLFAAHLLLLERRRRQNLLKTICRNILRLVGPIPDLQALETRLDDRVTDGHRDLAIYHGSPPMLLRSWDLLVRHSRRRFSTIPAGSLSDRIAETIVASRPWLISRCDEESTADNLRPGTASVAAARRVLTKMVAQVQPADIEGIQSYLIERNEVLEPLESTLLDIAANAPTDALVDESELTHESALAKLGVRAIQAPSYSIARSALSLASKIGSRYKNFE